MLRDIVRRAELGRYVFVADDLKDILFIGNRNYFGLEVETVVLDNVLFFLEPIQHERVKRNVARLVDQHEASVVVVEPRDVNHNDESADFD